MIKYRIIVCLLFVATFLVALNVNAAITSTNLIGKVIYLDPGHGGKDPGTTYNDIYEKDLNLEITKVLAEELSKKGAIVLLTRDGDYDLASPKAYLRKRTDLRNRANLINKSNCHLYLSIHLNYYHSPKWSGPQVFYNEMNKYNKLLAEELEKSFKNNFNNARDSKIIKNQYLYDHVTRPGVLIEVGFLSNPNDRYLIKQKWYQRKVAITIIDAISKYINKY